MRPRRTPTLPAPTRVVTALLWCLLLLALAATVWVGTWILARLVVVTSAVVAALFLTALLQPAVDALVRLRLPRWLASLLTVLATLFLIGGAGYLLVERFVEQSDDLGVALRRSGRELRSWLLDTPLPVDARQLDRLPGEMLDNLGKVVPTPAASAGMAAEVLTVIALALFLWFFLLKDGRTMWGWFVSWTPERHRGTVDTAGVRSWDVVTRYARGTVVIALADAVGTGVAMAILKVPLALSLSLLVFLGAFVPVVGTALAGAAAVAATFVTVGALEALILLGAVIVVQQLEGNLLQPLVMGRALHLHPVSIVLAVTAGTLLAGVLGALVAVPLMAVGYRLADDHVRPRDQRTPTSEPAARE